MPPSTGCSRSGVSTAQAERVATILGSFARFASEGMG